MRKEEMILISAKALTELLAQLKTKPVSDWTNQDCKRVDTLMAILEYDVKRLDETSKVA